MGHKLINNLKCTFIISSGNLTSGIPSQWWALCVHGCLSPEVCRTSWLYITQWQLHISLPRPIHHSATIHQSPVPSTCQMGANLWTQEYRVVQWSRAVSRFAPSQWETALLCNDVSHWLGANLESALMKYVDRRHCTWGFYKMLPWVSSQINSCCAGFILRDKNM